MDSFVRSCACGGRKPATLHIEQCRLRLGLMSKMMRDRGAVRFLSAPHRFGKSAAAFGYAESIFHLDDVFWIPANDPRFLRDLDLGKLGDYLLGASTRPCLVVIDDLPYLHIGRCEKLSRALELVLSRGWEAVVTAVPSCDGSKLLSVPIVHFGVPDLLLDDAEAQEASERRLAAVRPAATARVAGLAWAPAEERRGFLSRVLDEEVPSEMLFAHLVLLMLRRGDLASLARMRRAESSSLVALLAELYPYLGIDLAAGTFDATGFPFADVTAAAKTHAERAVVAVRGLTVDRWGALMADALTARGEPALACRTALELCSPSEREAWLERRQGDLACAGCVLPAERIAESVQRAVGAVGSAVQAGGAWRSLWLGRRGQAVAAADAVAHDAEAPEDARLCAGVLLACERPDDDRAFDLVIRLASGGSDDAAASLDAARRAWAETTARRLDGAATEQACRTAALRWAALCLAAARRGRTDDVTLAANQAQAALDAGGAGAGTVACLHAGIAFDASVRLRRAGGLSATARAATDRLLPLARRALARATQEGPCSLFALQLVEKAEASLPGKVVVGLPARFVAELRRMKEDLDAQREEDAARQAGEDGPRQAMCAHGIERIPRLRLRLFGGMEAFVGERPVDARSFRRQKVQTIAAILAIARGKEVSVDFLEDTLWPSSVSSRARNNFYNNWSLLKRALEVAPKECPYLVRLQNSCRMEASLVDTDVDEFLALCDRLQYSVADSTALPALFARIEALYAGDLVPSETKHPTIVAYRAELRNRLVDALVCTSTRAREAHELAVALQAARTALRYDEGREDAYNALIRAQTAAGQRSNAMATYFRCRSYLSEKLGIDPSPQTAALYQRLLIDEAPVGEQLSLPL